jgi:hypothetical protein
MVAPFAQYVSFVRCCSKKRKNSSFIHVITPGDVTFVNTFFADTYEMKKKQIKKAPELKIAADPTSLRKLKRNLAILIGLVAVLLYANSATNDYTLDDHPAIDQNKVTTQGVAGIPTILKTDYWYGFGMGELRGPIYRPTSLIVFATCGNFLQIIRSCITC